MLDFSVTQKYNINICDTEINAGDKMECSIIYDLLLYKLHKYREQLENEENTYSEDIKKSREALENSLNKEQLKLVDDYRYDVIMREEYIAELLDIRLINLAVKIGMQLQNAFEKEF